MSEKGTMLFTFVYRTADIYISALSKLRESAYISAVGCTILNGIVARGELRFYRGLFGGTVLLLKCNCKNSLRCLPMNVVWS